MVRQSLAAVTGISPTFGRKTKIASLSDCLFPCLLLIRVQHCIFVRTYTYKCDLPDDVAEQEANEAGLFYVSCLTCSFHQCQAMIQNAPPDVSLFLESPIWTSMDCQSSGIIR